MQKENTPSNKERQKEDVVVVTKRNEDEETHKKKASQKPPLTVTHHSCQSQHRKNHASSGTKSTEQKVHPPPKRNIDIFCAGIDKTRENERIRECIEKDKSYRNTSIGHNFNERPAMRKQKKENKRHVEHCLVRSVEGYQP
ncbi:hypothetical protein A3D11_03595 [Candidatus Peribacteria bacterium RIFCSPHIGHO2_02_FULL_49_16]|nr:MAG: hypothetical protein A2880_04555 [Candidatus Peribacteria bacterium RIFCSPHIGHO2_01_FULL_49_38]OGJ58817.1 MAG: hypothetical protein A3D11_03595 [Candidatus Peribacteria bacterium RIFCSPHIGHO2_02_FULL_49_16]